MNTPHATNDAQAPINLDRQTTTRRVHRLAAATAAGEYMPLLALYLVAGSALGVLLAEAQLGELFTADRIAESAVYSAAAEFTSGSGVLVSAVMAGGHSAAILASFLVVASVVTVLVAGTLMAFLRWRGVGSPAASARGCIETIARLTASTTIVLLTAAAHLHDRGVGLPVHTAWIITAAIAFTVGIIARYLRHVSTARQWTAPPAPFGMATATPLASALVKGTPS